MFSFHEGSPGVRDDGERIAETLGVDIEVIDRLIWHQCGLLGLLSGSRPFPAVPINSLA